jgi:trehalose/maltose hydrolase-like predicted phosphorylase
MSGALRCVLGAALCLFATTAWTDDEDSFTLSASSEDFRTYFPGLLGNGYFSTLTTLRGTEATPVYLAGFMDRDPADVSRPAAVPGWTSIDYSTGATITGQSWLNKAPLNSRHFQDYRQTLNTHEGTLTTSYGYLEGDKLTHIEVQTLISAAAPHLAATRLRLTPQFDGEVQLSFALNPWALHAPRFALAQLTGAQMELAVAANQLTLEPEFPARADRATIWYSGDTLVDSAAVDQSALTLSLSGRAREGLAMAEAVAIELPAGIPPGQISAEQSAYRLGLNVRLRVERGRTYVFTKYAAVSRAGWGGDVQDDLRLAETARSAGFAALLQAQVSAWHALWNTDIVIEGDDAAQRLVHSELYYLLASTTAETDWSVGACALTTGYLGHVFWDADSWIFPALVLLHPERAQSMLSFRTKTLPAAEARAHAHGFEGAMFPWESDPENGSEQTPHFAYVLGDREIHVNADVAIAQWLYYLASGDREWLRRAGWPVIEGVAKFWASRATYVPSAHRYEILHVTSVDESYSDVPNDTFTNLGAARALGIATAAARALGRQPDPRWDAVAAGLFIPLAPDGRSHIEFDPSVPRLDSGWTGGSLSLLFLPSFDLPMSEALRRADFDVAIEPADKAHIGSASMGLPPRSIAAASVGDGATLTAALRANFTGGTLKSPFNVRTETAGNNTGYFLTGSGGFLQSLIFGYTGLRIRPEGLVPAYAPILPEGWRSMTLKHIVVRGKHENIRVARDGAGHIQLTREPLP